MLVAEWNKSPLSIKKQKQILSEVTKALKIKKKTAVSVAFITPDKIKKLNHDYRGKNKVTDVLSFNFDTDGLLGEILICLAQAKKQAKSFGYSLEDEVTILLVHGLLHLFGHDHLKTSEAQKMFTLKKKILKKLKVDWEPVAAG
ncbi:MAG: rRNA maturation RNase YbeY [Candidatus Uhrbacteria bacterium]